MRLFVETLAISTGNSLSVELRAEDQEALNAYIPARSLLFLARDIFVQEDVKAGNIAIQVSARDNEIDVLMKLYSTGTMDRLSSSIKDLEDRFKNSYHSEVGISLTEQRNALWEIDFKLSK
jgi:7-cyano-7-deazaguanine synthase in queuosine biosynthesis